MVDVVDSATRSRMMSGIRAKNTRPEILIRKALHRKGFRYTLHNARLPGKPDLALPRYRAIIFIHGCFWHGHECKLFKWPSTRPEFWRNKIFGNRSRDQKHVEALMASGWRVLIVWECSTRPQIGHALDKVVDRIAEWIITGEEFDVIETGGMHVRRQIE